MDHPFSTGKAFTNQEKGICGGPISLDELSKIDPTHFPRPHPLNPKQHKENNKNNNVNIPKDSKLRPFSSSDGCPSPSRSRSRSKRPIGNLCSSFGDPKTITENNSTMVLLPYFFLF